MKISDNMKFRDKSHLSTPRAPLPLLLHSLALHPTSQALLISTILTSVSLLFVNDTITILTTRIGKFFSHCSLEESFAAFTTVAERRVQRQNKFYMFEIERQHSDGKKICVKILAWPWIAENAVHASKFRSPEHSIVLATRPITADCTQMLCIAERMIRWILFAARCLFAIQWEFHVV